MVEKDLENLKLGDLIKTTSCVRLLRNYPVHGINYIYPSDSVMHCSGLTEYHDTSNTILTVTNEYNNEEHYITCVDCNAVIYRIFMSDRDLVERV